MKYSSGQLLSRLLSRLASALSGLLNGLPCPSKHGCIQTQAHFVAFYGQKVAVAVKGGLDRSVAELSLDEFGVGVLSNQEGRVGVTQIVETDLAKASPGAEIFFNSVLCPRNSG